MRCASRATLPLSVARWRTDRPSVSETARLAVSCFVREKSSLGDVLLDQER